MKLHGYVCSGLVVASLAALQLATAYAHDKSDTKRVRIQAPITVEADGRWERQGRLLESGREHTFAYQKGPVT